MTDYRIQYLERMIGAGHPSLDDSLNRLTLTGHTSAGEHRADNIYPNLTTSIPLQ